MRSWFVAQRRTLTLLPAHAIFRRYLLEEGKLIAEAVGRAREPARKPPPLI
jgi:hypothetical protein